MRGTRKRLATLVAGLAVVGALSACTPTAAPAPTGCDDSAASGNAVIVGILDRVNSDRAANGLGPLAWNPQLYCLATDWSGQMAASGTLQHRDLNAVINSPEYSSYHTLGENILRGPSSLTANEMADAWMASPDHQANILSTAYSSIGIGLMTSGNTVYATQNFGG